MRRWTISLTAAVVAGLAFLSPGAARAQEKEKFKEVKFETFDGVKLIGRYWPTSKAMGREAPVAILLHKVGARSKDQGWSELAEEMQKAGFAVLSFDFRGHGESTEVAAQFWKHPINATVRRKPGAELPTSVSFNDFPPAYLPHLVNDIAAAKQFLETRYNNTSECNCSNIILVGAEDGATLGTLWLASETKRFRILKVGMMGQKNDEPESKDVAACIWLNISSSIGRYNVQQLTLRKWILEAGNTPDSKVPMAFTYGKLDTASGSFALQMAKVIRGANYDPKKKAPETDKLRGTVEFGVPEVKLVGAKLLTNQPALESLVKKYLTGFILDEKKLNAWREREKKDEFIWLFPREKPIPTQRMPVPVGHLR